MVQGGGRVCLVRDLHPLGASRDKAIDSGGQHRPSETLPLELVLDPDGFDEPHLRGRVEPVQRVAGDPSIGGLDSEVERRVVSGFLRLLGGFIGGFFGPFGGSCLFVLTALTRATTSPTNLSTKAQNHYYNRAFLSPVVVLEQLQLVVRCDHL